MSFQKRENVSKHTYLLTYLRWIPARVEDTKIPAEMDGILQKFSYSIIWLEREAAASVVAETIQVDNFHAYGMCSVEKGHEQRPLETFWKARSFFENTK